MPNVEIVKVEKKTSWDVTVDGVYCGRTRYIEGRGRPQKYFTPIGGLQNMVRDVIETSYLEGYTIEILRAKIRDYYYAIEQDVPFDDAGEPFATMERRDTEQYMARTA